MTTLLMPWSIKPGQPDAAHILAKEYIGPRCTECDASEKRGRPFRC